MPVQRYKLANAVFNLVFSNELGDFYRYHYDDEMRANNITLEKEHLIKMGATPITEPDEELIELEEDEAILRRCIEADASGGKRYLAEKIAQLSKHINSLNKQLREMKG